MGFAGDNRPDYFHVMDEKIMLRKMKRFSVKKFYWINENNELIIPEYNRNSYKGENGTTQKQITNRKVAKINIETNEIIIIYDSIALASRENNCDSSAIAKVCRGKR